MTATRETYLAVECYLCHARCVRLYRPGGNFYRPESNRCLACITEEEFGWMVPLVLSANYEPWGYTSAPSDDIKVWLELREAVAGGQVASSAKRMRDQLEEFIMEAFP